MSKEKIFKELITEMARDGEISSAEYAILLEKGKDLGLTQKTVDLLIKLEFSDHAENPFSSLSDEEGYTLHSSKKISDETYTFKSAITRGGSILTPEKITVSRNAVTFKKRNKNLINTDTITILIKNISSVKVDTSIWGTDIYIKTFGKGEIIGKRFTKSDALEIAQLIRERQG